jgi:cobalt-zinc-cadmium efflux system outer membrane protein
MHAQEQSVLKLTPDQFEALFLKNNLQLIAGQMDIDIADAAVIQAKLWDNPELSIGSVNFWSTEKQRDGEDEKVQFTAELSQLIQTANKRGKLVRREKVAKEIAGKEFEELLRGLKTELRKSIYETCYLQAYIRVLNIQAESLEQLINTYRKQVREGNIARSELLRLQSSLLEIENEMNELHLALNENQKTLKGLINADPLVRIEFENSDNRPVIPDNIPLAALLEQSPETRPDIKRQQLTTQYHEKSSAYEKSLRVPDLTLNASYDRYGGVWKDFVGFGFSISLPFLNRNQGNIKATRFLSEQSRYLEEQQQKLARNEILQAYDNYCRSYAFFTKISDDDFLSELDLMLDIYAKNLLNKNISMLEYIDFMDTYRSNKQIVLESGKNTKILLEELQYVAATDLKP